MSFTPERRVTPPGITVHSLVNTGVAQDIPSLRVEAAGGERSFSSLSTSSQTSLTGSLAGGKGNVLNDAYSPLATFCVNTSVGLLFMLSFVVLLLGQSTIMYLYQFTGFVITFMMVFIISFSGYLWLISWVNETLDMNTGTIIRFILGCTMSEGFSWLAYSAVISSNIPIPWSVPFYAVHSAAMLLIFVCVLHQKGMEAVLSYETCAFVCLTIVLHYISWSLFSSVLPRLFYSMLVYGSCSLALCSARIILKYLPSISIVGLKRIIKQNLSSRKEVLPPSYAGRRFSNASIMSNVSSVRPRNSITDQSSFSGYQDMIDIDGLTEANGMIGDLLFQEERLTQKGRESLKKIQQLLMVKNHGFSVQYLPRSRLGSNESDVTSGASSYSPNTRRVSFSQKRNQGSQFTTTTTSTGLPNVEKDPLERKRSQASRDRARISLVEGGRPSIHRLSSPLVRQYKKSLPNLSPNRDYSDGLTTPTSSDSGGVSPAPSPISTPEEIRRVRRMNSKADSLDVITEQDETKPTPPAKGVQRSMSDSETDVFVENVSKQIIREAVSSSRSNSLVATTDKVPLYFNTYFDPPKISVEAFEDSRVDLLDQVDDWDFPIFEMEKLSNGNVLSQMAFCLFKEGGLMETFNIPQQEFINYFRALEANYGSKTYHNRTHAADVLHATSYLLFEEIPEFSYEPQDLTDLPTDDSSRPWIGNLRSKVSNGNIASAFSILEVFACYLAAAMHDFDHPGRTNAFLVATRNPLAILYNDRSVLENHHAAASWDLLMAHEDKNFLKNLDSSEMKRLRFLIIECILATDLKHHFEIVGSFREKFDPETTGGIDWGNDVDRLQVMKMVIKMADINTPTKNLELHRSWTVRITEEFYQQHEDEMRLSLPQTIFMDRHETEKLPAIQVSFIQNLVAPLFRACAEVGIIPGEVEPVEEGSDDVLDEDSIPDEAALIRPTKKIFSVILNNLQMNYEAWKDELPREPNDTSSEVTDEEDED